MAFRKVYSKSGNINRLAANHFDCCKLLFDHFVDLRNTIDHHPDEVHASRAVTAIRVPAVPGSFVTCSGYFLKRATHDNPARNIYHRKLYFMITGYP